MTDGHDPLERLRQAASARDAVGMRRTLRPRGPHDDVLDLASNDYLGLARDPRVVAAGVDALRTWGAGSTGSRLVTGTTALHAELEDELADFVGTPAALVYSSGYLANIGAVTALSGPGTLVVSDQLNHASLVDACRLSRADVVVVPHRDLDAVRRALSGRTQPNAVVVTDSVFSVDGDLAPLDELCRLAQEHRALLVVDDAHGLGVLSDGGRGAAAAAGIASRTHVVITLTLSKSLGSQGGAVLGAREVVDHCVNTARSFIFDTGLAPASAGSALGALGVLRAEPERAERVRRRARELCIVATAAGFTTSAPTGAVTSAVVGAAGAAVVAAATCLDDGVRVGCFRPPSVPDGQCRLRLTARADLTDDDLARAAHALAGAWSAASRV